jgi:hypothetical protein
VSLARYYDRWSSAAPLSSPRADLRLIVTLGTQRGAGAGAGGRAGGGGGGGGGGEEAEVVHSEEHEVSAERMVVAIGGCDDKGHVVEQVEYLDTHRDHWQPYSHFPTHTVLTAARVARSPPEQGKGAASAAGSEEGGEGAEGAEGEGEGEVPDDGLDEEEREFVGKEQVCER